MKFQSKKKDIIFIFINKDMFNKKSQKRNTFQLYHGKKLIDDMHVENVGCEYGEYDKD